MSVMTRPEVKKIPGGKCWEQTYENFYLKSYLPDNNIEGQVNNYTFRAPFLLVFEENKMSIDVLRRNRCLKIGKPRIEYTDYETAKLITCIEEDDISFDSVFEVSIEYGQYFSLDRIDFLVYALFPVAIRNWRKNHERRNKMPARRLHT